MNLTNITADICYICKNTNDSPLYVACNCLPIHYTFGSKSHYNSKSHYKCLAKWITKGAANGNKLCFKCIICGADYPTIQIKKINWIKIYLLIFTIINILLFIGVSYDIIDIKNFIINKKSTIKKDLFIIANIIFGILGILTSQNNNLFAINHSQYKFINANIIIANIIIFINIIIGAIIYSIIFNKFTINIFSSALGNSIYFIIITSIYGGDHINTNKFYKNILLYKNILSPIDIKYKLVQQQICIKK